MVSHKRGRLRFHPSLHLHLNRSPRQDALQKYSLRRYQLLSGNTPSVLQLLDMHSPKIYRLPLYLWRSPSAERGRETRSPNVGFPLGLSSRHCRQISESQLCRSAFHFLRCSPKDICFRVGCVPAGSLLWLTPTFSTTIESRPRDLLSSQT